MPYYDENATEIKDLEFYNCVRKVDLETGKVLKTTSCGPTQSCGEVYFQHRDGAPRSEDDGYLMTVSHCQKTETSFFVMWDAQTFDVVCRVQLDQRVPYGFHSTFVKRCDY